LQDDELLGHRIPRGSWLIVHLQGIHYQYQEPLAWRPERFMPGGEYDQFDESIRPYMVGMEAVVIVELMSFLRSWWCMLQGVSSH
jgi:hypothetical protein